LCKDLVIGVSEYPDEEVLDEMGIESELELMGLFQGVGLPFQSVTESGQMPNMVWLYRVPILLYWAEHEETLGHLVRHVLVHEIGHHFGLSDEAMHRIEDEADDEGPA
jgi:predicted Zn-dependent protease with MMP-like domain